MKNKRGWIRILEATIAVMMVSGVLVTVYSRNLSEGVDFGEYVFTLQKQVLLDISSNDTLREWVVFESDDNDYLSYLNETVREKIPLLFDYSLNVCSLGEIDDVGDCNLDTEEIIATKDKDVFVEDVIISATFIEEGYAPKKVRLFVWEN